MYHGMTYMVQQTSWNIHTCDACKATLFCVHLSPKSLLRFLQTTTPNKKHAQFNQACINPSLHCKVLFYQTTPTDSVPLFAPI